MSLIILYQTEQKVVSLLNYLNCVFLFVLLLNMHQMYLCSSILLIDGSAQLSLITFVWLKSWRNRQFVLICSYMVTDAFRVNLDCNLFLNLFFLIFLSWYLSDGNDLFASPLVLVINIVDSCPIHIYFLITQVNTH